MRLQVTGAKLKLPSAVGAPKGGFVLTFRPASREGLDEHVVPIGVPAFLRCVGPAGAGGGRAGASGVGIGVGRGGAGAERRRRGEASGGGRGVRRAAGWDAARGRPVGYRHARQWPSKVNALQVRVCRKCQKLYNDVLCACADVFILPTGPAA